MRQTGTPQHRGADAQPEVAARTAARCARDRRLAAQRAQQVERIREPERDPLEHGAHDVAARVARAQADERAARVRVGVGRALTREVGQEEDAAGTGGRRLGLGHQLVERHAGRERVARPLQRARGREHHAHGVPAARHRVAEHVHARLRDRAGRRAGPRRRRPRCRAPARRARAAPRRRRARRPRNRRRPPPPARPRRCGPRSRATRATRGIHASGTSSASSTALEKRRSATSNSSVPEASATSIARSPQSRSRT